MPSRGRARGPFGASVTELVHGSLRSNGQGEMGAYARDGFDRHLAFVSRKMSGFVVVSAELFEDEMSSSFGCSRCQETGPKKGRGRPHILRRN